jgi:hypothetical protein
LRITQRMAIYHGAGRDASQCIQGRNVRATADAGK